MWERHWNLMVRIFVECFYLSSNQNKWRASTCFAGTHIFINCICCNLHCLLMLLCLYKYLYFHFSAKRTCSSTLLIMLFHIFCQNASSLHLQNHYLPVCMSSCECIIGPLVITSNSNLKWFSFVFLRQHVLMR